MVVVPSLLETTGEINHLLQELELYYLSNPDPQLTFALLTDFGDAPQQNMPEDENLLRQARAGIENLNKKYAETTPFYLFHRQRQWNPSEGAWMGWERKRGKLADFNRLLLNLGETAYQIQIGEMSILTGIKYVITLDADTTLTQGSANRLVATLAHPLTMLNFPRMDVQSSPGIAYCSRAWQLNPPARTVHSFHKSLPGIPGLTCTLSPSRMSIRICLAKAVTLAKEFTMLWLLSAAWRARCARIPCSAMTCLKGFMGRAALSHGYCPL